jgi:crotonobetainyl-CoA:carnitine CoA-transferase CaiB-like acyl-CoA transferase
MTSSATSASSEGTRPLAGLHVLDFTIVMSGPLCTRMMADAGADVVKVESPDGDVVRHRPPHRAGFSTYYASMNCGKRSILLDLKHPEARSIARDLALRADVLVENFRPGVMRRLGLDYASLAPANPRLVYCSISGFGQTGPKASAPAYAPVIAATSGFELAHAEYQRSSDKPANNGIFLADVLGATHAVGAIQLALYHRERTGAGQHIDVSLVESVLGMLVYEIQAAQFKPERSRQVYEPVRSNDGFVMVAAVTPRNLDVLFDAIGFPEGKGDPRFATVQSKEENWPALLDIIERWTSSRSGAECEAHLTRAGVPCARYRTVAEAMADPQLAARGFLREIGEPDAPFKVANQPYVFSTMNVSAKPLLATLGQHTDEVLAELLDIPASRRAELRACGAFGAVPKPQAPVAAAAAQ